MLDDRGYNDFYRQTITRLRAQGVLDVAGSVLVVCGGSLDRDVLQEQSFSRVTISNLDVRMKPEQCAPYEWIRQDAEQLEFADNSFDYCIVHSGLHHCASPHRALLEMYRVARRAAVMIEPYDNVLTRLGVWLGVGQEYELAAVFYNSLESGGMRNTSIPNYVYRFSRREILKTVACYDPAVRPRVRFIRRVEIPWGQLKARRNKLYLAAALGAWPFLWLLSRCVPAVCTRIAAVIEKPDRRTRLQPWLCLGEDQEVKPNRQWLEARFQK